MRVHRGPGVKGVGSNPVSKADAGPSKRAIERKEGGTADGVDDRVFDRMWFRHQEDEDVKRRIELEGTHHSCPKERKEVGKAMLSWMRDGTRVDKGPRSELGDTIFDALSTMHVEHCAILTIEIFG